MICPDCKGDGIQVFDHLSCHCGGRNHVPVKCFRCRGNGNVPDAMADWISRGRALRDRRVNGIPYRTLREEANRRGITVVELSRMEMGKIEPVEG